jgi:hypothetical protein
MTALEFIQGSMAELHSAMIDDVKVLTEEHLAWKAAPKANPIGFLFWHFIRTEDLVIHSLQAKAAVWESEKWYEKLGLDAKAQGTGFQEPAVEKIASLPLPDLLSYADRVIQSTSEYLKSLDDASLDRALNPNRPQQTIALMLRSFILSHGWWHLGEIKYIKGMQGMPAAR